MRPYSTPIGRTQKNAAPAHNIVGHLSRTSLDPCWEHSPEPCPSSVTLASWAHAHPALAPAIGIQLCTHLPAPRVQPTAPLFTLSTLTNGGPAPCSPPSIVFTVDIPLLPCHATPIFCLPPSPPSPSFQYASTTQVSHANTATSVLFRYNRSYHGETRNCTNPNLGPRSCFWFSVVWSQSL